MTDDHHDQRHPLEQDRHPSGLSRRDFLKISGISAAVPLVTGPSVVMAAGKEVEVLGPGKVPMEFRTNGKKYKAALEPRVTLLDALRDHFELTGAKRVCDRGECGACTVLLDNRAVYSCMVLAIEARQRRPAMRVLHPGFCDGLQGISRQTSQSNS